MLTIIFQVTATSKTNTNITIYIVIITRLVRSQMTQISQSKPVSNSRTAPELRDDPKDRPRKLTNEKHEWKLSFKRWSQNYLTTCNTNCL